MTIKCFFFETLKDGKTDREVLKKSGEINMQHAIRTF